MTVHDDDDDEAGSREGCVCVCYLFGGFRVDGLSDDQRTDDTECAGVSTQTLDL